MIYTMYLHCTLDNTLYRLSVCLQYICNSCVENSDEFLKHDVLLILVEALRLPSSKFKYKVCTLLYSKVPK